MKCHSERSDESPLSAPTLIKIHLMKCHSERSDESKYFYRTIVKNILIMYPNELKTLKHFFYICQSIEKFNRELKIIKENGERTITNKTY